METRPYTKHLKLLLPEEVGWQKGHVKFKAQYNFGLAPEHITKVTVSLRDCENKPDPTYEVVGEKEYTLERSISEECVFEIRPRKIETIDLNFGIQFRDIGGMPIGMRLSIVVKGPFVQSDQSHTRIYALRNDLLTKIVKSLDANKFSIVWVYGPPQFGKTVLARQLVQRLREKETLPGTPIYMDLSDSEVKLRWQFFSRFAKALYQNSSGYGGDYRSLINERKYKESADGLDEVELSSYLDNEFRFNYLAVTDLLERETCLVLDGLFSRPEVYSSELVADTADTKDRSELVDAIFELMMLSIRKPLKLVVFDFLSFKERLRTFNLSSLRMNLEEYVTEVRMPRLSLQETRDLVSNNFSNGFAGKAIVNANTLENFYEGVGGHPKLICDGLHYTDWLYMYSENPGQYLMPIDTKGQDFQRSVKDLINIYEKSRQFPEELKKKFSNVCQLQGSWLPGAEYASISRKDAQKLADLGLLRKMRGRPTMYQTTEVFKDFDRA